MDPLLGQCIALIIGIGFLVSLLLQSGAGEWCIQQWKFWCYAAHMDGPSALPILGNSHYFAGNANDLLKKFEVLAEQYISPFRLWMGPKLVIAITNPPEIQQVITSSKTTYKPSEYRFVETFLGRGLITSSGPTHKKHRALIMPLVNGKVLDTYIDSFDTQSRRCVECLGTMVDKGEFDIMHFMNLCTIDITFDSVIGAPAIAQQNGHTELISCLHKMFHLSYERGFKFWLHPDFIFYRTRRGKEFKHAKTVAEKFMHNMLAEKKKMYFDSKNDGENSNLMQSIVLEQLVAYNEENKVMNDRQIIDEVFTVFAAAQDPIALASAFLFLMLGMHPNVQDKVRAEIREVVGDGTLTPKTISELKYLDMVVKETVRLFPIGSLLFRKAEEDLKIGTCTAPKGCTIAIFAFGVHRDPKFWKEPEKFDPDRFLPENSVGRHPYAYIPFSGGVRGCIGQQYAKVAIKTLATRVVQKYRIHSNGSLGNLKLATDISVRSLDGYKVSITEL